jgi:hypothetical protein
MLRATLRHVGHVSCALIMSSNLVLTVMLLGAGVTQAILTVFGQAHTAKYCVAIRRDANVAAGVVEEDNLH